MAISKFTQGSPIPSGATGVIFSGNSTYGDYTYTTSLPAGNYIVGQLNGSGATATVTTQNGSPYTTNAEGIAYFKTTAATTSLNVNVPLRTYTYTIPAIAASLNPNCRPEFVNGVIYSGNHQGYILESTDGRAWTTRTGAWQTTGTSYVTQVHYNAALTGNKFNAIGGFSGTTQSYIWQSTDGITWTSANSSSLSSSMSNAQAIAIATNNAVTNKYVVTAAYQASYTYATFGYSTNGTTWSPGGSLMFPTNQNLQCSFLASLGTNITCSYVGATNYSTGALVTSTDGITWVSRTGPFATPSYSFMKALNGLYWAGGSAGISSSTDGITWTNQYSLQQCNDLIYSGSTYYASVYTSYPIFGYITSTNGTTWSSFKPYGVTTTATQYLAHFPANNSLVTVGSNGATGAATQPSLISLYSATATSLN